MDVGRGCETIVQRGLNWLNPPDRIPPEYKITVLEEETRLQYPEPNLRISISLDHVVERRNEDCVDVPEQVDN